MQDVNWLSFVFAALIPLLVGFIWYHPKVFGKAWMHSIGMTEEKAKQANMAVVFGVSIFMSGLMALFMLSYVNGPTQEGQFDTFGHGAFHGLGIGIVLAIPILVTNGLFEQRSWKNMLINAGYWTLCFVLMGGVLDAMNTFSFD